ncbi:zona pellucida protein C [Brachionichthys hirsutus]|uniref:zona pellucida protein C n=1 Tax=Brachionichthys hirsutus TaxID=412623 RepID=UPI003604C98E
MNDCNVLGIRILCIGGRSARRGDVPDVSVTCSASDLVLRVKPSFFGLGADAEELKLGASCRNNGVLEPHGDFLFTYHLTECGVVRQADSHYLIYKFVLHYAPSLERFPSRAHRIDVDIECRYQRNHHVRQLAIQPTWKPAVVRKRLKGSPKDFQIELMDGSWSGPVSSRVYRLGEPVHFQVSALPLPTGGKLYIDRCYATGSESSHNYTIIDNLGCMLDSKRDRGASRFVSRSDGALRFSMKAFQFTSDPDKEVSVHCVLFVTSKDPGPAHKSCSYEGNRWEALAGKDSICECCDSQCVTSKARRALLEGSAVAKSLLVSDQPYTDEDGFPQIRPASASTRRKGEVDPENRRVLSFKRPDVEELGFMEEEFEEHLALGEYSRSEEEEGYSRREDEVQQVSHLNQTGGEMLERGLPSEVSRPSELPWFSEGEGERGRYTGRGEDDEMKNEALENREMTWYFTWR